jgi:ribosomal-protein-alanine N-acetyltransferase
MRIRFARPADLARLEEINTTAGPAAHWSRQQWLEVFVSTTPKRLVWVAEEDAAAVGFLVAQCSGPDWELENIAVLPELQRGGAGRALVEELVARARTERAERILLEVRASNRAAIGLYHQNGFQKMAVRGGYYSNPPEDALIMVLSLRK